MDHTTLENDTITLRERDTMGQSRIALSELDRVLGEAVSFP